MYKTLLPHNEECIFENIFLVMINMNNSINKVVNI